MRGHHKRSGLEARASPQGRNRGTTLSSARAPGRVTARLLIPSAYDLPKQHRPGAPAPRPQRGGGRPAQGRRPGQRRPDPHGAHLRAHRARQRLQLHQQPLLRAGRRAARPGQAARRLRRRLRHLRQHRHQPHPGGAGQARHGPHRHPHAPQGERGARRARCRTSTRRQVVLGDILYLHPGDQVVVDGPHGRRGPHGGRRVAAHRRVGPGDQASRRRACSRAASA